eukprot:NODE_972_length_1733_cov_33.774595_g911_i0.p1 GENE.NODE_972_length_1733_cov_33.774595_g911_i0~~NODE_972_length_1733_cov_33.774595_g911_i0.p1  ORF type:complete len:536 (+),score=137.88 NODE_972_length_1733_cov_33.774595_g911_i0:44-1651(+)
MAEEWSESNYTARLEKITIAAVDIKGIGRWVVAHPNEASAAVELWEASLQRADPTQTIALLYLCNEIMLTSKDKTSAFVVEFMAIMESTLTMLQAKGLPPVQNTIEKLVAIWGKRKLFSAKFIKKLEAAVKGPEEEEEEDLLADAGGYDPMAVKPSTPAPPTPVAPMEPPKPKEPPLKLSLKDRLRQLSSARTKEPEPEQESANGINEVMSVALPQKRSISEITPAYPEFTLQMTPAQLDAIVGLTKSLLTKQLDVLEKAPPVETPARSIVQKSAVDSLKMELAECESNVMLLTDILQCRQAGKMFSQKILNAFPQLKRMFPTLCIPDQRGAAEAQLQQWTEFEAKCRVCLNAVENKLKEKRAQRDSINGHQLRPSSKMLTTAWGPAPAIMEADLVHLRGKTPRLDRLVFLQLATFPEFFLQYAQPFPATTALQVFVGAPLKLPDVPINAPFLRQVEPFSIVFTRAEDLVMQMAVTEAHKMHQPDVKFLLICSHEMYFNVMKSVDLKNQARRILSHLNPSTIPHTAILAAVSDVP